MSIIYINQKIRFTFKLFQITMFNLSIGLCRFWVNFKFSTLKIFLVAFIKLCKFWIDLNCIARIRRKCGPIYTLYALKNFSV